MHQSTNQPTQLRIEHKPQLRLEHKPSKRVMYDEFHRVELYLRSMRTSKPDLFLRVPGAARN